MLLTGSYRRALDDKLRLSVPKPQREQLTAGEPLYLTPGLDGCLAVYTQESFAALADLLAASSPAAREVRGYSRLFFSQAASVIPDAQWRFRIPAELIAWARIDGEAVVVGVRDHLEIWAVDRWETYVAEHDGQYERLAEAALLGGAAAMPVLRQLEKNPALTQSESPSRMPPR